MNARAASPRFSIAASSDAASAPRRVGYAVVALVGFALVGLSATADLAQAWGGLLVAGLFGASLTLGGVVFAAVQGAANGRWWLPIRSIPVGLAAGTLAPAVVLAVVLLFGHTALYPWAGGSAAAGVTASVLEHVEHAKGAWLNVPFFLTRALIILVVWVGVARALAGALGRPDAPPRLLRSRSVMALILLAVTVSVAAFDWCMSLEPTWYSTMFGAYLFFGIVQAGIAAVALLALAKKGAARATGDQLHRLGTLLFAFSCFWAYIAFCQYMLIWYADLPEEASYFVARSTGGWTALVALGALLNFGVPLVVLMAARAKRHRLTLGYVALAVLVGRFVDTYVLVGPALGPLPSFPLAAVAGTVAVLALIRLVATAPRLGLVPLAARRADPSG